MSNLLHTESYPTMSSMKKSSAITLPPPSFQKNPTPSGWPGGDRDIQNMRPIPGLWQTSNTEITVLGADIIAATFGGENVKKTIQAPAPQGQYIPKGSAIPSMEPPSFQPSSGPPNMLPPTSITMGGVRPPANVSFPGPPMQPGMFNPQQQQMPLTPLDKPGWPPRPRGPEFPPTTPPGNFPGIRPSPYSWQRPNLRRPSFEEERQHHPHGFPPLHFPESSQNPYVYRRTDGEPGYLPQVIHVGLLKGTCHHHL